MELRQGRWIQVDLPRAIVAGALLAALAALVYLVLIPGGSAEDAPPPAAMVDTPPGEAGLSAGVHPGSLARDFEASDVAGDSRARLSDLRGRPVVINFWATWCTSCLAEMPVLERQRLEHQADGLAIVAVNVGEGRGDARAFLESLELEDFVVAMDPTLVISDAYAVRGLPHSVFIDADGVIQAEYRGQVDEETMDEYVRAAIEASPGAEPPFRPRFVTTVPREHLLEVLPADEPGTVTFVSPRFRCDDDYCADTIVEQVREIDGLRSHEVDGERAPATLTVVYDVATIDLDELVELVAAALRSHADPLYTRPLEITYAD